jgi:hypothetical protein
MIIIIIVIAVAILLAILSTDLSHPVVASKTYYDNFPVPFLFKREIFKFVIVILFRQDKNLIFVYSFIYRISYSFPSYIR